MAAGCPDVDGWALLVYQKPGVYLRLHDHSNTVGSADIPNGEEGLTTHLWDYIWDILLDHGGEMNLGLCWKQMNRTWVLEHNILIKDEAWMIRSLSDVSSGPKPWFSCPCKLPSHWHSVHSDVITAERMWKKYLKVSSGIGVKKSEFLLAASLFLFRLIEPNFYVVHYSFRGPHTKEPWELSK